jgi:cysteinyl-tRNA synthetase
VELRFFNTLGRRMEEFRPLRPGEVSLYTCGPTVWNSAHIGNLRTYVFEDLLVRTLRFFGYRVKRVMNITDVGHLTDDADQGEDKMIKGARERGLTVWEIAEFYTQAFFADLDALNVIRPDVTCRATEHIQTMIDLISRIEQAGFAYSAGGNLYFDVGRLPDYGKLTGQNLEELKAGARIEVDSNKRSPLDFVLWFTRSKFEHQAMLWDSPWGRGYPGWHIECSAMAMEYLGERIDLHCGGVDHIPVHHTNEIAQSEAVTGQRWVNVWLHGEFLVLAREKMAKSAGNFLTLGALREQGYDPLDYRYLLLGAHYRSQLQFSIEALQGARMARRNLRDRLGRLLSELTPEQRSAVAAAAEGAAGGAAGAVPQAAGGGQGDHLAAFAAHLAADLNVPQALADLWGVLRDERLPAMARVQGALALDRVLGLDLGKVEPLGADVEVDEEVRALIQQREEARGRKEFARADQIRDSLRRRGIVLEDTPEGVRWRRDPSHSRGKDPESL